MAALRRYVSPATRFVKRNPYGFMRPGPTPPTPAQKTWEIPNAQGVTGQQALLAAWTAKQQGVDAPGEPTTPLAPDSQYFADQAKRQFEVAQGHAANKQAQSYDETDFHEALRRMAEQRPQELQGAKEAANRQGLLFSGTLGKNLGEIETSYARRQGDEQLAFDRRTAARSAADAALEQGLSIDQAAAIAGSADRQIQRDQDAALAGYLALNPASPATTQATAAKPVVAAKRAVTTTGFNKKRGQRFQTIRRGGQIFHRYAGGRDVRVG